MDGVETIGESAFDSCSSLNSISLPASVTTISNSAFKGCTQLTSIVLLGEVTHIGSRAFTNTSLTEIYLPATVTFIGTRAFSNCYDLAIINYEGTEEMWNDISKDADWDYNAGIDTNNDTYEIRYNQ
jgi:hypothetical protein